METTQTATAAAIIAKLDKISSDLSYYRSLGVMSNSELLEITHNLIDGLIADSAMATE